MAKVPITPPVLTWAMAEVGVDEHALAVTTGRELGEVRAWIAGADTPHQGDLRKIARLLGRSPYFFMRSKAPARSTAAAARRASLGVPTDASRDELLAVRTADQIRRHASWLAGVEGHPPVALPQLPHATEEAAQALRTWLKLDLRDDQVKVGSKAGVFKRLRSRSEANGVIVLLIKFGPRAPQGFSIFDVNTPVIVINEDYQLASVRTYTLLHELCHLASGSVSFEHDDDSFERWAESVAAATLIPSDDLKYYLETYRKQAHVGPRDVESIRLIAKRYGASWHATAIRLAELSISPPSIISAFAQGEPADKGFARGGQSRAEKRIQEFGYTYAQLLTNGVETGKISALDARRYLRLSSSAELAALETLAAVGT